MVCSALLDSKDGRAAPASMEASVRDIDDVETKDDGGCTVSYVLQRNLVSPCCLSIPILQKKSYHKYPRYCSMRSTPVSTKDPRYFIKKIVASTCSNSDGLNIS
jgi:hypothetical protein